MCLRINLQNHLTELNKFSFFTDIEATMSSVVSPVLWQSGVGGITLRPQPRLDIKWLKSDLQSLLQPDNLPSLYNQMVKDGEVAGPHAEGILNSAGVTARKSKCRSLGFFFLSDFH